MDKRLGVLIATIALALAVPAAAAPSYTFRQDVVDFDHPLEFDVHVSGGTHLEGQAQWAGSWRDGTGVLYIVQPDVAECSISGGKTLRCTVGNFFPGGDVAPEGWYEVELAVSQTYYPPLLNAAVKVSGDIDAVIPPGD